MKFYHIEACPAELWCALVDLLQVRPHSLGDQHIVPVLADLRTQHFTILILKETVIDLTWALADVAVHEVEVSGSVVIIDIIYLEDAVARRLWLADALGGGEALAQCLQRAVGSEGRLRLLLVAVYLYALPVVLQDVHAPALEPLEVHEVTHVLPLLLV